MSVLESFHPVVAHWFTGNFGAPSPPQQQGWPVIAGGEHSLILAPTGSGKTLAAFLWCIDDLFRTGLQADPQTFEKNPAGVHTLYISPLKALNNDIHVNLQEPLRGIHQIAQKQDLTPPRIRAAVRTGDTPSHIRQSMVKKPPHILITTPESLYLLLTSERGRAIFHNLRYIIVDEIHAMSNNKRGVHLSLSLERLMPLCQKEPVRIGLSATQKPLERIASFLGGQQYSQASNTFIPRPVTIVDCGQRKNLDLQVISPVPDFTDLPDASVWPALIEKLYGLITSHRTTLVFVNMRAQTEKIARQLNELHSRKTGGTGESIALAHHGSISREVRYDIEETLKKGKIPAVIATASLELGIDIGSIDLVVQVETPKTVTSALQRVGRSGHLLKATSKGRIFPLYQADLDDAVAFTRFMLNSDIEETHIPENCLDVLAQQIVAEVALRDWSRPGLYRLFRQSYCYRFLSETVFNNVVDMLSGRFEKNELRALQPRLTWDKVNDRLIARRGSRLLAVMNGGTIADRAYYAVYLADTGTRLGEVEEEFVFESKVGDVFFLGNNEWRINQITRDRIIVTPLGSVKPRAPFWKSEPLYRDFKTSQKIGAFRQEMLNNPDSEVWLSASCHADPDISHNLLNYMRRQAEYTGSIPTHNRIILEHFRDSAGEPQIVIHAPFGGRVLGAWATVLAAVLEQRYDVQSQYSYDDDGILLRLVDVTEPPPIEDLLGLSADEMEKILTAHLTTTPLFAVRFRHNATRALLLQRSRADKRIPLWLQRLRAADLLQVVREFPDFPILIETIRDCLQDVFDLKGLLTVVEDIQHKRIKIDIVHTPSPSPMASGLLFRFLSEYMYDYDKTRTTGYAAEISNELLAEVLQKETIPAIVSRNIIEQAESIWQGTAPESRAKDAEDLFALIEKTGPVDTEQLTARSKQNPDEWLKKLQNENRICYFNGIRDGWIVTGEQKVFTDIKSSGSARILLQRLFRISGPLTVTEMKERTALPPKLIETVLTGLSAEKLIVRGKLVENESAEYYCDRYNFSQLYRRAIAVRREAARPGDRSVFYAFLQKWHHINTPEKSVSDIITLYNGLYLPPKVFERDILRTRMFGSQQSLTGLPDSMQQFIQSGEVFVRAKKVNAESRTKLCFTVRGGGHIFTSRDTLANITNFDKQTIAVYDFLRENGASFFRDIVDGSGLTGLQTENGLLQLVLHGLAGCDHYTSFLSLLGASVKKQTETAPDWHEQIKPDWSAAMRQKHGRRPARRDIREKLRRHEGRWFLTSSFAVHGTDTDDRGRAEKQARLLLDRYGVLVKEFYRFEDGLLPWHRIFQVLKKLEWSGEIRRGYFIRGLSGLQFALPGAMELLEKIQSGGGYESRETCLLSTVDPALPFGGAISWELTDKSGNKIGVTRLASNHILFAGSKPAVYSENYGTRLFLCADLDNETKAELPAALKIWLKLPAMYRPKKRLEIESIDNKPASVHELAAVFTANGYETDGDKLALWPSGV
ncbi:DEAD/DEAH box helicase [candidate division KSB1 bacterium]|nr:DEAD/DEAH box helicase [candidate division KSB1 bacterium]